MHQRMPRSSKMKKDIYIPTLKYLSLEFFVDATSNGLLSWGGLHSGYKTNIIAMIPMK